ncbi:MAG TPA: DUF4926 domain-containing protein [bacterium]|nr:DUF4926 domain-containing protein [bacterium]HPO08304.1 DUF4926 domain-containing protein [bacterium]HQO35352.1 DUF4926 domain-containing protein [bacterium]HQQ01094.1 DUF4926 domain-containing protein [bacterium]
MIAEHERVVLTSPIPECQLVPGDVGTVVHIYSDRTACEVEFVMLDGHTAAVATVEMSQLRPVSSHDITHAREHVMA